MALYVGGYHLYPGQNPRNKKKPKKTPASPVKSKVTRPATTLMDSLPSLLSDTQARDQVMQLLQPIFASQDARINSIYNQQADAAKRAYEALAQWSQGIAPQIQNTYQSAAKDTAAFGKGFSDAVSQISSGHANDATAAIAAQGGPQTVTSGLANGGGDALYAIGGAIPGSQLEREGAAFTSAASLLPRTAAGYGAEALGGIEAQRASDLLGAGENRPQTIMDAINDLLDESYSRRQDALKLAQQAQGGGTTAKPTYRNLANGQIGTFVNGKLVRASGPPKALSSSATKLQARTLANGQVQWFDPTTGAAVGKPVGPPRQKGKGSAPSNKLQARSLANGQIQWFNPRTGKAVGAPVGPPRASSKSSSAAAKPYGMTPTQIRKATGNAFAITKGWKANGMRDDDGNPVRAQDLLKHMTQEEQIPFGIAVRQLAKVFPPAKKWYKPKNEKAAASATTPQNASIVQDAMNAGPRSGIKYVFGGAGPNGFDCSGYTMTMVQEHTGVQLPHQARAQFYDPRGVDVPKGQLQPGDVVFFRSSPNGQGDGPPYHCGYYIGNGKYVEYYSSGKPARVSSLNSRSDFMGARRFGGTSA